MKRIVILVLMMLIGGYGAAYAQQPPPTETTPPAGTQTSTGTPPRSTTTETEAATKEFLGLKWGLGIGVTGGFGGDAAVEKASIVGTGKIVRVDEGGDFRPQMFLEMHAFVVNPKAKCWREYQQRMSIWREGSRHASQETKDAKCPSWKDDKEPLMPDPPLMGFGPFVALQGSENQIINAFTLGVMWGFRKDPKASNSVNVGVGLSFDPSVQVLGHGVREGQPLPAGEDVVRFKKEGRFGWAVMTSFTF